jgi:hypothetical protein
MEAAEKRARAGGHDGPMDQDTTLPARPTAWHHRPPGPPSSATSGAPRDSTPLKCAKNKPKVQLVKKCGKAIEFTRPLYPTNGLGPWVTIAPPRTSAAQQSGLEPLSPVEGPFFRQNSSPRLLSGHCNVRSGGAGGSIASQRLQSRNTPAAGSVNETITRQGKLLWSHFFYHLNPHRTCCVDQVL